jgi:predicted RNA binding protein YcfA (HicA-like mRNA interferase family)
MPPLPVVSGAEVIKALENAGFTLARVKGSHHMMKSPEGRFTVVPVHGGKEPPGHSAGSYATRVCLSPNSRRCSKNLHPHSGN